MSLISSKILLIQDLNFSLLECLFAYTIAFFTSNTSARHPSSRIPPFSEVPQYETRCSLAREYFMKLYVGNLPYSHNDFALQDLFSPFGEVVSAQVITDHHSGRSRGFGFVEMTNNQEAQKAQEALHGSSLEGRDLVVNEAHEKKRSRN